LFVEELRYPTGKENKLSLSRQVEKGRRGKGGMFLIFQKDLRGRRESKAESIWGGAGRKHVSDLVVNIPGTGEDNLE